MDLSSFRKRQIVFRKLERANLGKEHELRAGFLKDAVPARGIAVINALVKRYNQNGIDNKEDRVRGDGGVHQRAAGRDQPRVGNDRTTGGRLQEDE